MKPSNPDPAPDPVPPDRRPPESMAQPDDETAHYDDAVIGSALKWSALAVAVLAIAGLIAYFSFRPKKLVAPSRVTTFSAPTNPQRAAPQMPTIKFTDTTAAAGIRFSHFNGAAGDKLLPETMGSGVAFFDYDNDQHPDLLFVNSAPWPEQGQRTNPLPTLALYHNDGTGHFSDVTRGSGLDVSIYGMGTAMGDFDNDGLTDVFVTAVGQNRLFRNLGQGRFADVTAAAGVAGVTNQWSSCAAWLDADNDGDLDLFVGNYVRWSRAIDFEVGYSLVGIGRAYGPPMNFEGSVPYLYRNEGNGRFTDVASSAGLQMKNANTHVPAAKTLGIAPVDLDRDGWIDLVVANDTVQNYVFHNQKNGTFKEIGATTGIAFDSYGNTRGAMGIDSGYFQNNEQLGIAIGNFANEMTALYVSHGKPLLFTDETITEGIGPTSRLPLKFGIFFFDYDLDGWQDLLSVNGHLEEEISKIQKNQKYAQSAQLFWNNAGAGFITATPEHVGTDLFRPIVGRGSAYADIDSDGDLDVVFTQVAGTPLLLRNDQNLGRHFVRLKLQGATANRDAIGAWITVRAGSLTQTRQVMPTRSYLSQSELPVTFGLGNAARVDEVRIEWPGGGIQKVDQVPVDKLVVVKQAAP